MKKLIRGILLSILLLLGISTSEAQTPRMIIGGQGECDTTNIGCQVIPLTVTSVCVNAVGQCPIRAAASYTDVNRFWGTATAIGACSTSTNGGGTWVACTVQPFSSGAKEHYAGAADGSTIAVAQVAGNCVVKRSIDNAASWTTVMTYATSAGCGGANAGGTLLKCLSNGTCTIPFVNPGTQVCHVLQSTNNGVTWTSGTTVTGCIETPSGSAFDGTNGILAPQAGNSAQVMFTNSGFSGWNRSAAWPVNTFNCWGNVIYNSAPYAICYSSTNGAYQLRSTTGAVIQTLILPGSLLAIDNGGLGYSIGTNNLYVFATTSVGTRSGVWVTRDGGSTFVLIATNPVATSMREGDVFRSNLNGCIYFAINTMFGKIC